MHTLRIKGLEKSIKSLVLSLCLLSLGSIHAQNSKYGLMGSVGLSRPILDNGWGVQGGLHVNRYLRDWFELGSQLSYQRTNISDAFLSGEEARMNSILLLAGGRFYVIPKTKDTRVYLNFLIGGMYINERKDSQETNLVLAYLPGSICNFKEWSLVYQQKRSSLCS